MPTKQKDPMQGYSEIPTAAPRAELVQGPDSSTATADVKSQEPSVYAGITTDHALRVMRAQNPNMLIDAGNYMEIYKQALKDAQDYQKTEAESRQQMGRTLFQKQVELLPGGTAEQQKVLDVRSSLAQKQLEQGKSATQQSLQQGPLGTTLVSKPSDQQQKDWSALTEGFHNLQDAHNLFNSMAQKTVGAGGAVQSLAGLTTKLTDLTSPEARTYHAYIESSLIPLAKSIMGDAATTAGKETVQSAMTEALPTNVDTLQSGGQKMYMFYKRALDKMQTERDMARQNGVDTSSIDTTLGDFHSWMERPEVKQYNPLLSEPLVQSHVSPDAQKTFTEQVQKTAMAGSNQAPGNLSPVNYPAPPGIPPPGSLQPFNYPAPPGLGTAPAPGVIGTTTDQPSAVEKAIVDLPGQLKQLLTPKPGGPTENLAAPPF